MNGKCGFSVRTALEKRYAGLDGRDDHMFVGFRSAVTVRFEVRAYVILGFAVLMLTVGRSGRLMINGRTRLDIQIRYPPTTSFSASFPSPFPLQIREN